MLKTNKENLLADLAMSAKHPYLKMDVKESNLVHDALHAHTLEARIDKVLAGLSKTLEAIQQYHEDDEEFCENIEKDFDNLKAILGGE